MTLFFARELFRLKDSFARLCLCFFANKLKKYILPTAKIRYTPLKDINLDNKKYFVGSTNVTLQ